MIQGGTNLEWTRPLQKDDEVLGGHRGHHSALNIRNPEPGFQYYYARADANQILRFRQQGWEVVTNEDPEQWGADLPENIQRQLDSVKAYQDVILLKIPLESYKRNKASLRELAQASSGRTTSEYLDRNAERQEQLSGASESRPVYHKRADHGTHIQEK
jgi:hypothetical protein